MNEGTILDNTLYKYNELEGSNALILPSSKEERKRLHNSRSNVNNTTGKINLKSKKMSKRKKRKLQQLEKKKLNTEFRTSLNNEMQKYSLQKKERMLMMSVSNSRITRKQRDILIKQFERANIDIPDFLMNKIPKKESFCLNYKDDFIDEEKVTEKMENENSNLDIVVEIDNKNTSIGLDNIKENAKEYNMDNELSSSGKFDKPNYEKPAERVRKVIELKLADCNDKPKITRKPEIELQRSDLPVRMYECEILDSIENNDFVIITGATGSGKSTQVPQLLYEMGYCPFKSKSLVNNKKRFMIGLTQPRRIATISLSKRIEEELNDPDVVGYHVRYDNSNYSDKTIIKVMTDGILLQEIQRDLLCSNYSVIIIDEAHERTVNTDVLIGLLSKVVVYRRLEYEKNKEKLDLKENNILPPLKLIIMSATLRVTDFSENPKLFKEPPPIVDIETPNYPVTIHFSKKTPTDYILAAHKKVLQIHKKLPPGSILVFVTGKREVNILVDMINRRFNKKGIKKTIEKHSKNLSTSNLNCLFDLNENDDEIYEEMEMEDFKDDYVNCDDELKSEEEYSESEEDDDVILQEDADFKVDIDENLNGGKESTIWNNFNEKDNRKRKIRLHKDVDPAVWKGGGFIEEKEENVIDNNTKFEGRKSSNAVILKAIPLYASMSYDEQKEAFKLPESNNIRHVIISTNVSETSITIPNVRYVIDTGKEKRRQYSKNTDLSQFKVEWISKASSHQRSGRAGRVGPGHCYRLYSSSVYENIFSKFSPIGILSIPLDSVLLYMHSLGIPDIFNFPFPTPPEKDQIEKSYEILRTLGCIETSGGKPLLTNQGISLSKLPLAPRYGKLLLMTIAYIRMNLKDNYNEQLELLKLICIVVSFLAVGNIRDNTADEKPNLSKDNNEFENIPKSSFGNDIEASLWLCIKYLEHYGSGKRSEREVSDKFCRNFCLNSRRMSEMRLMSQQLYNIAIDRYINVKDNLNLIEAFKVKRKLIPPSLPNSVQKQVIRTFFISSFIDHIAVRSDGGLTDKLSYLTPNEVNDSMPQIITIDSNSIIKNIKPKYLVYGQIISTTDGLKQNLCECILITPDDITRATSLIHPLIDCSKILSYPTPYYSPERDKVFGYCIPKYRNNSIVIDLSSSEVEIDKFSILSCEVFAKAILDGQVFKQFGDQEILKYLKIKNNSKAFKYFAFYLQRNKACSKNDLNTIFAKKRDFMLKEVLSLYDISVHNKIRGFWPPI
ncbi:HrpA family SFII helicase [Cryptosporidium ryanae]|uniref:HrpA family SFII helicase n=1 Tax=Cryptosporidium ryanae TaxID=515981 RepID=UPI00351A90AE|nr:HrpA family SFII helicase [Cryptosporidium ryanae]